MTHLLISYQNINANNLIPPPYRNFVVRSIFIEKQYPKWFSNLHVMQLAKTVYYTTSIIFPTAELGAMFTYNILA